MKKERVVNRITLIGITLALVFSLGLVYAPDLFAIESSTVSLGYETKIFDKSKVMTIDIQMPEEKFNLMLENAISETYYSCDVVVNGTTFQNVGIRPKGNTSLTQVASDDTTDRFSFKVEFDHYNNTQTCYGLDKLALNNLMADATYMKEYLSYDILNYLGVPSSLYSYANITVNGQPWGLYLAVECVEESFALRNFGNGYGQLYKPDSYGVGGMDQDGGKQQLMNQGGFSDRLNNQEGTPNINQEGIPNVNPEGTPNRNQNEASNANQNGTQNPAPNTEPNTSGESVEPNSSGVKEELGSIEIEDPIRMEESLRGGGMGQKGGMENSSETALIYLDDEIDSYSTIFDSALFDITKKDKERVITALKNINEGNELESYLDVDTMLRYIAANVFVINDDSYFSTMTHNYYLYESNGKLSMLPWDYNLSFGGFQGSNATDLVNRGIDTVVSGTTLANRPMIGKVLEIEEYKEQYHSYLDELITGYFESGYFEELVTSLRTLLDDYVKKDATAFYSYEEYLVAQENLVQFCNLRAESIRGQLNHTIPSTEEEQTNSDVLIDASGVSIAAMGTQGGNKGGFGNLQLPNQSQENVPVNKPESGNTEGNNQLTPPSGNTEGETQLTPPSGNTEGETQLTPPSWNTDATSGASLPIEKGNQEGMMPQHQKPGGNQELPGLKDEGISTLNVLILVVCTVVLIAATLTVIVYKRHKYRS